MMLHAPVITCKSHQHDPSCLHDAEWTCHITVSANNAALHEQTDVDVGL